MAGAAQDNDEEITGINVTPLVDITLVLLVMATYVAYMRWRVRPIRSRSAGVSV